MESAREPGQKALVASFAEHDFNQVTQSQQSLKPAKKTFDWAEPTDKKIEITEIDNTADAQPISAITEIVSASNLVDTQGQPELLLEEEASFTEMRKSRRKLIQSPTSNEELEFDNGESPRRFLQSSKQSPGTLEEERKSLIPTMLGDSILVDRLTEAYEELEASILHEMSEEFDDHLAALDEQQMKHNQQPKRLPANSKVMKSLKKPLEIQVIEEMEDEEASANPHGRNISPGAMAGDNFKF